MKLELKLAQDIGRQLSDGYQAAEYRRARIEPYISMCEKIVLDFTDVRNANSSFVNSLIAGTIEQHGDGVLKTLVFKGCNPAIQVLVEGAVYLGTSKISGRHPA